MIYVGGVVKMLKRTFFNTLNTLNISGVVSFFRFEINEKTILLFGDRHSEYTVKKSSQNDDGSYISFPDWIDTQIVNNRTAKTTCLDIYVESPYDFIHVNGGNKKEKTVVSLIDDIRRKEYYFNLHHSRKKKHIIYTRFHYWDISQIINDRDNSEFKVTILLAGEFNVDIANFNIEIFDNFGQIIQLHSEEMKLIQLLCYKKRLNDEKTSEPAPDHSTYCRCLFYKLFRV